MRGDLIRQEFAKRLNDEIAKRNWNQSDLAREATKHLPDGKLSRDSVSNYMNAKALPGPGFLLAMAKALNTTSDELLPNREPTAMAEKDALRTMDVRDLGGGWAFLRVNKRVRFNTAVKVMEALAEDMLQDTRE